MLNQIQLPISSGPLLLSNIDPELSQIVCSNHEIKHQIVNNPDSRSSTASNTPFSMSTIERITDDETITDIDEEPAADTVEIRQNNNLLSLLSGNQYSKKTENRLKSKEKKVEEPTSSFTEVSSSLLGKEHDLIELERRFHNENVKTISAKSFLAKGLNNGESGTAVVKNEVIEDTKPFTDIRSIEAKIYGNSANRVNARDIFKSLKPKTEKKTMIVSLKISSLRLEEISNPFKTRGNTSKLSDGEVSLLSILQRPKPSKKVTLKVDPVRLKSIISQLNNPLFSRGTGLFKGTSRSANSVFQSMMQNASSGVKLTKLQKLKELDPPKLERAYFHVYSKDDDLHYTNDTLKQLTPRSKTEQKIEDEVPFTYQEISRHELTTKYTKQEVFIDDINQHVLTKLPQITQSPILNRVYRNFIGQLHGNISGWSTHFQPQTIEELFTLKNNQVYIQNWLTSAFERLKVQSLRKPRNVQLKQQKKRTALDGFIIEDFDYEDSVEQEAIFTPLLIIHGSVGAGKSSSVYAAMKEIGGYVHEINSGQPRGRKDTFNQLKELCTTHLVHAQPQQNKLEYNLTSDREFQKGIILLEDCDILFEQDKGFWSMVYDIVNISKRPIIITCGDLDRIPNNLYQLAMQENAVLSLDTRTDQSDKDLVDYLWLCCLSRGYDVNWEVLEDLVDETSSQEHHDLRKLFVEVEMVCSGKDPSSTSFIYVDYASKMEENCGLAGLAEITQSLEILSVGDVISSNSKSAINHEAPVNELVDVYMISDESQLHQPTLSYELNIGEYLQLIEGIKKTNPHERYTFNELKGEVKEYIGSRTKKLSKSAIELQLTRSMTRSRSTPNYDFNLGITGISEVSSLHSLTKTLYFLELAPFCRTWKTFQKALDAAEQKSMENNVSVKAFLDWRQFQSENTRFLDSFIRTYTLDL